MNRHPRRRLSDRRVSWWPPSWVTSVVIAMLGLAGLSATVVWYEFSEAREDARRACERAVDVRHDTRAMWLELFEAFPDSPAEPGLRRDLEARLPVLVCDGSDPVPVVP